MRTLSRCWFATIAAVWLGAMACSSSSLKTPPDAITADTSVGRNDVGDDAGAIPRDSATPQPDLATPDTERADQVPPKDALSGKDTSADLLLPKDARALDMPSSIADVPTADVPAVDVRAAEVSVDVPSVCTPGKHQTCNDESVVSSLWGTCNADGTCTCKTGYVVNPATGRCMIAPKNDASVGDDALSGLCLGQYDACGCGCCGATQPITVCYYPTAGETLDPIKAKDDEIRATTDCSKVGCTTVTRYVCCVPASSDPLSATYTADAWSGGMDHLTIKKSGADCAEVAFAAPTSPRSGWRVEAPEGWSVANATLGACGGTSEQAKGGLGTLAFRKDGTGCVVDVHMTLFAIAPLGEVRTVRLDADGLLISTSGGPFCP